MSGFVGTKGAILRITLRSSAVLFAIIVFGTTVDQVQTRYFGVNVCLLGLHTDFEKYGDSDKHGDANACNYAIAVGVMAFLIAVAFICFDALLCLLNLGNERIQFVVALADLILSLILSVLWLVAFIYLTDKAVNSGPKNEDPFTSENKAAVGACIAFSLFSSLIWGGLGFLAFCQCKTSRTAIIS